MALITRDDLKAELQLKDSEDNSLADTICAAVQNLFDVLTDRSWEESELTEYYDTDSMQDKLMLNNYPVNATATFSIYDAPDWDYTSDDLISSDYYKVDKDKGIVHHASYFYGGGQSVKVVYKAGYTPTTLPAGIKQVLVRQAVVWFNQAKAGTWDVQSVSVPAGGGGVSIERHARGLLPEFEALVKREAA